MSHPASVAPLDELKAGLAAAKWQFSDELSEEVDADLLYKRSSRLGYLYVLVKTVPTLDGDRLAEIAAALAEFTKRPKMAHVTVILVAERTEAGFPESVTKETFPSIKTELKNTLKTGDMPAWLAEMMIEAANLEKADYYVVDLLGQRLWASRRNPLDATYRQKTRMISQAFSLPRPVVFPGIRSELAASMKMELVGWSLALILIGVISLWLPKYLGLFWGVILIGLGAVTLTARTHLMFLAIGAVFLLVGVMIMVADVPHFRLGLVLLGILPITCACLEFFKFCKYASAAPPPEELGSLPGALLLGSIMGAGIIGLVLLLTEAVVGPRPLSSSLENEAVLTPLFIGGALCAYAVIAQVVAMRRARLTRSRDSSEIAED